MRLTRHLKLEEGKKMKKYYIGCLFAAISAGCASPPSSDPSKVESVCAQQCSDNLATCSGGVKLFPVIQQKQCNDNYDVCIKGCPARSEQTTDIQPDSRTTSERLEELDALFSSGAITEDEYKAKREEILKSI